MNKSLLCIQSLIYKKKRTGSFYHTHNIERKKHCALHNTSYSSCVGHVRFWKRVISLVNLQLEWVRHRYYQSKELHIQSLNSQMKKRKCLYLIQVDLRYKEGVSRRRNKNNKTIKNSFVRLQIWHAMLVSPPPPIVVI